MVICQNGILVSILLSLLSFSIVSCQSRPLVKVQSHFKPLSQPEGDSANVRRIIGGQHLKRLDPFLMLDYFVVRLPAGFPDHPHRGFETVTYMLEGTFFHEDFKGNAGILSKGDVQWMTAGRGIVHSEMPGSYEEDSIGFQLWVNLKQVDKMVKPAYQEIKASRLPVWKEEGLTVKVISGSYQNLKGTIDLRVRTKFLDVELNGSSNMEFSELTDFQENCFIYVYEGSVVIGKEIFESNTAIIIQRPSSGFLQYIEISKHSTTNISKFILLCGEPTNEAVYSKGPFVLDSESNLEATFNDYSKGINGFEGAPGWRSKMPDLPREPKIQANKKKIDL